MCISSISEQYENHEIFRGFHVTLDSSKNLFFIKYIFSLATLMLLRFFKISNSVAVGNPRKLLWRPFLISERIYLIDDGLGSVVKDGYFDPQTPGSNLVKARLINFFHLPRYRESVLRANGYFTFLHQYRNIFQGVERLPIKFDCKICDADGAYVGMPEMSLAVLTNLQYMRDLSNVEMNLSNISEDVPRYVSFHPMEVRRIKDYITERFGLVELELAGLSTEEFVSIRANLGLITHIHGMLNTSSALIKSIQNFQGRMRIDFIDHVTGELIDNSVYRRE